MRLSKDSLKELFTALSPPGTVTSPRLPFSAPPDDEDDKDQRREVREWMEKKNVERMKEFRKKLRELREAEKHPFKPSNKTVKQVLIIIIKNEKIRVTLCENAAGALYIVNKMCVDCQRNVQG